MKKPTDLDESLKSLCATLPDLGLVLRFAWVEPIGRFAEMTEQEIRDMRAYLLEQDKPLVVVLSMDKSLALVEEGALTEEGLLRFQSTCRGMLEDGIIQELKKE